MTSTQATSETASATSRARKGDMKLEVTVIAVADVERAKRFYSSLGWRLDADFEAGEAFRVIQFTPPGSPSSIHFGKGVTPAAPGSANSFLVVTDIEAARAELVARGIDVSAVFHTDGPGKPPRSGRHPEGRTYSSFASFKDPDGNTWLLQEVTLRLPGRVEGNAATYSSPSDLASALRRAAEAHGEHEKRTPGRKHDDWPEWYAEYMVAERTGNQLPT